MARKNRFALPPDLQRIADEIDERMNSPELQRMRESLKRHEAMALGDSVSLKPSPELQRIIDEIERQRNSPELQRIRDAMDETEARTEAMLDEMEERAAQGRLEADARAKEEAPRAKRGRPKDTGKPDETLVKETVAVMERDKLNSTAAAGKVLGRSASQADVKRIAKKARGIIAT